MRNRNERLIAGKAGLGAQCDWQWTSDLYISKVYPALGRRLMKRALRDWPIKLLAEPVRQDNDVEVSFIIGHRGKDRLPHLLATLRSIAAQRKAEFECIVVEQSLSEEVKARLPEWVRYVHTPLPDPGLPYCRSWAFNVGARKAKGKILVLHDNDLLAPQDYASEIAAQYKEGYEVINLKRFIFYAGESHSKRLFYAQESIMDEPPETIMQNALGGGSLAVAREAYFALGGFDESFIGWGGEDNEFWERAQTLSVWPFGYLPFVHLWHPDQTGKYSQERFTARLFERRSAIPAKQRIRELTTRDFGSLEQISAPCVEREQV
jgi:GT2 family glycosyltransferase